MTGTNLSSHGSTRAVAVADKLQVEIGYHRGSTLKHTRSNGNLSIKEYKGQPGKSGATSCRYNDRDFGRKGVLMQEPVRGPDCRQS